MFINSKNVKQVIFKDWESFHPTHNKFGYQTFIFILSKFHPTPCAFSIPIVLPCILQKQWCIN